jgi:hypothetical protein
MILAWEDQDASMKVRLVPCPSVATRMKKTVVRGGSIFEPAEGSAP